MYQFQKNGEFTCWLITNIVITFDDEPPLKGMIYFESSRIATRKTY